MTRDELEYAISQYLDGVLPPLEQSALEERLASDPEARAVLAEYQKLDASLKLAMPMPQVHWERFASGVRQALSDQPTPVRNYSIRTLSWTQRLAIAAGLLFAITASVFVFRTDTGGIDVAHSTPPQAQPPIVVVTRPSDPSANPPIVQNIQIGPAPNLSNQYRAPEEIIIRPTIVQIDRGISSGQDNDLY